ncbi:Serine-threonine protein kinase [Dorcoceras hygrometricum]|uniref:Serine-threonine protein kinase n=1 Tax=Dorcoceras hygrometricum TaxID=472368 RepID=A0A2Z7B9Y9_9LAMI|nr:Serine-threonine protein kinase [Dorcoceras hygrometricum]
MASLSFTNAYLVDFYSVLEIPDNEGMQKMLKSLETSGIRGFLGCKPVLYQSELGQFFDTALVQDEDITGSISGKYFTATPSRFAGVFELPTEGISNFSDVPNNQVYDARRIFSKSGEHVDTHGNKKFLKYEYRLLNDILEKSITVKAGSFDAVTNEGNGEP